MLVCCVAALVLTGVLLAAGPPSGHGLADIRSTLETVAGVLFFGAGLLQLAEWRVDRDPARGHTGLALLVLGFLAPRITALGPALHDDVTAQVLSPWTAITVTVLAMTLGARGPGLVDRSSPRTVVGVAATVLLAVLSVPLLIGRALPFPLDVPRPAHLLAELGMAVLLLAVAVRLRRRPTAQAASGSELEVVLVTTIGIVWLLRAAAVLALHPWALASTVLLTTVAVMTLVRSASTFSAVFDARDRRVAETEDSLSAAMRALAELDGEHRLFRHDARNSMFALNAAAQVLAQHGPDLDEATRLRLRDAIRGELVVLERLLTGSGVASTSAFPQQRRFGSANYRESA